MDQIICPNCKKKFTPEPGWEEFCSLKCEIEWDDKLFEQEIDRIMIVE